MSSGVTQVSKNEVGFESKAAVKTFNPDSQPNHLYSAEASTVKSLDTNSEPRWYTRIFNAIRDIFSKIWDKITGWFSSAPSEAKKGKHLSAHFDELYDTSQREAAEKVKKIKESQAYKDDPLAVIAQLTVERHPNISEDRLYCFDKDPVLSSLKHDQGLRQTGDVLSKVDASKEEAFTRALCNAYLLKFETILKTIETSLGDGTAASQEYSKFKSQLSGMSTLLERLKSDNAKDSRQMDQIEVVEASVKETGTMVDNKIKEYNRALSQYQNQSNRS